MSIYTPTSLVAERVKNLLAMQDTQVQSLGREDALVKAMATHSSILAWTSMDRGAWRVIVHGVAESDMIEQLTLSLSYSNKGSREGDP